MFPPLTNVLIKTLGRGFYRSHSGLLFFFFIAFIMYFFFINVLNENHIPPDELILHNLILVLTFISSPVMAVLIFILWLIYTIKSWSYIVEQLLVADNRFLFYSSTSFHKVHQFKSWFIVQLIISLPIVFYGLFSVVIGIVFHYYIIPLIIVLYILLLITISAILYVWYINRLKDFGSQSFFLRTAYNWGKPFFSLFLYYIFDKLKFSFVITKMASLLIIVGVFHLFSNEASDLRLQSIVVLSVVLAHIILIYEYHRFEEIYLSFSRNLPYSRIRLFINFIFLYVLMLLPENFWILTKFDPATAIKLLLFALTAALLFHSLLYPIGLNMSNFIRALFGLFIAMFLIIMFNLLWLLIPLNLYVSFMLFYNRYYRILKLHQL